MIMRKKRMGKMGKYLSKVSISVSFTYVWYLVITMYIVTNNVLIILDLARDPLERRIL